MNVARCLALTAIFAAGAARSDGLLVSDDDSKIRTALTAIAAQHQNVIIRGTHTLERFEPGANPSPRVRFVEMH